MRTLAIILARAGSKGLPSKNSLDLSGEPLVHWTIQHAAHAKQLTQIVVSTDCPAVALTARESGLTVIDRPPLLATDTAPVAAAARHALLTTEAAQHLTYEAVIILYANVPLRPRDLIDRAINKLIETNCHSVQSVCPVGKNHPYWMKTLTGPASDQLTPFIENNIDRRQNLPPIYTLDGGIIAVQRNLLANTTDTDHPHAFLGTDRRAITTQPGQVVDIDTPQDLLVAEELLREQLYQDSKTERQQQPPFIITGRKLSHLHESGTYIIAELGVNHDGSLDTALELTHAAKQAGADAVKLQLFDAHLLLSAEAKLAEYQKESAADPFAMLNALQLTIDQMLEIKTLAHQLKLGFIVTPFSIENCDDMQRLDPDAVKIASPDAVNLPLINAVKSLNKPLIVSTGACNHDEIDQLMDWLSGHPYALLKCVSAYPVPDEQSLASMPLGVYHPADRPYGYSDHTNSIFTGMIAASHGATIIEKHITYDINAKGPDHAASFDPKQFTEYVRLIRLIEKQVRFASENQQPLPIESDVRTVSRQSICAKQNLTAGTTLKAEHITVKRPGTGIPAYLFNNVTGKTLKRDIAANHLLHKGDVDL